MPDDPHGTPRHAESHAPRRSAHRAMAHAAAHAHAEHEGAPEWLISFADMVMLMMGFFVILFALNVQPKGGNPGGGGQEHEGVANEPDLVDFAIAVRRAFHNEVDLSSTDPADQALIQRILSDRARGSGAGSGAASDAGTPGAERSVRSVRPSEGYGQGTHVGFPRRSAELTEAAGATLDDLARQLRGQSMVVEVRGHVGVGESYGDPERGMELAIDRALMAAKRLAAGGVDWWRIRVEAAGSNERLEPTPVDQAGDARNARVEVRVLDELAAPRGALSSPLPRHPAGLAD